MFRFLPIRNDYQSQWCKLIFSSENPCYIIESNSVLCEGSLTHKKPHLLFVVDDVVDGGTLMGSTVDINPGVQIFSAGNFAG